MKEDDLKARTIRLALVQLYLDNLSGKKSDSDSLREDLSRKSLISAENFQGIVAEMQNSGLISLNDDSELILTSSGRKKITVVMTGGTFDIIHPGHVETLGKAKFFGDVLIVSIARNKTVEKTKGRPPIHDETLRRELVSSIKSVDAAILGSTEDIFETLSLVRPDIVALGYDQYHTESSIIAGAKARGLDVRVVRMTASNPEIKTSSLLLGSFAEKKNLHRET